MVVNKIVIVGGGTAGWATALNFLQKTKNTEIVVIASKEKPIIGVGESTTGQFNDLIRSQGPVSIGETDFLKQTGSTFKIGIRHTDWHTIGESFTSPLGDEFVNERGYPSADYDYYRYYFLANKMPYVALQSKLMLNNKLNFLNVEKDNQLKEFFGNFTGKINLQFQHMAYHLDTYKVGQYIKDKMLQQERCTYIDDIVKGFDQDEKGFVTKLKTKTGKCIEGDLFVDCTGFARVLIDKVEKNNFVSYEKELTVNSALTFHVENKEDTIINNYTNVTAKKYGWLWDIPLQHRKGMGYVFNDQYINDEQAQKEIENDLGFKIEPRSLIKFKAGRHEKFWCKNVLSTGLASAFVEPLEATSIHMTMVQINYFLQNYFTNNMSFDNFSINNYNNSMTTVWDDIKDFIVLHYHSPRKDTEFWVQASSKKRKSDRLNNMLETWKHRLPRTVDYKSKLGDSFYHLGNTLWLQILMGMKILDSDMAKKELEQFDMYKYSENRYKAITNIENYCVNKAIENNSFYKEELNNLKEYKKVYLK